MMNKLLFPTSKTQNPNTNRAQNSAIMHQLLPTGFVMNHICHLTKLN